LPLPDINHFHHHRTNGTLSSVQLGPKQPTLISSVLPLMRPPLLPLFLYLQHLLMCCCCCGSKNLNAKCICILRFLGKHLAQICTQNRKRKPATKRIGPRSHSHGAKESSRRRGSWVKTVVIFSSAKTLLFSRAKS